MGNTRCSSLWSFALVRTKGPSVGHVTDHSGGGIIDLLNKRLRDRLKEIEILNIFTDVCDVSPRRGALTLTVRLLQQCTHSRDLCYIVI